MYFKIADTLLGLLNAVWQQFTFKVFSIKDIIILYSYDEQGLYARLPPSPKLCKCRDVTC